MFSEPPAPAMSLVTIAGYACILYILAKLLTYLSKYVRTPLNVNKLGDWSLVTGATDGIGRIISRVREGGDDTKIGIVGKGLCMELAGKGQNIILVSRTLSKLETVAKEIEEKYRVQTKIVDIDFSTEARVQERIEEAIKVYM